MPPYVICFVSTLHPPDDKRVFAKEAVSLAESGFQVLHIARGDGRRYRQGGVDILTFRASPPGRLNRIWQLLRVYRMARRTVVDCYHCNEPDAWFIGAILKISRRCHLVFDVHENYPAMVGQRQSHLLLRWLTTHAVYWLIRILTPFADRIVFAKPGDMIHYDSTAHRNVVCRNLPLIKLLDVTVAESPRRVRESTGISAIHIGNMTSIRGFTQLLKAMQLMGNETFSVTLMGTLSEDRDDSIQKQIDDVGLSDRVHLRPWMSLAEMFKELQNHDIGLVLFQPGYDNHRAALPHKLFDYMLAGLPVVVPECCPAIVEIVRAHDCGLVVDSSDPSAISSSLDKLASTPSVRHRMGENGRQAVLKEYNWESESTRLIQMYSELAATRMRGSRSVANEP